MANVITADQLLPVSVTFVDKEGNAAKVDGAPTWTSSNEDVATVKESEDGLSATVTSHKAGNAQITVIADADLGEGVVEVIGVLEVEVVAGIAAGITVAAGEAVNK